MVEDLNMSKDDLNISHISIDLDDSTLVHKFIELQHENEEESSVDWNDDFDLTKRMQVCPSAPTRTLPRIALNGQLAFRPSSPS